MTSNTLALFDSPEKMVLFGPLDATGLKPAIQDPFLKTVCWLQVNNVLFQRILAGPVSPMRKNSNKFFTVVGSVDSVAMLLQP